MDTFTTRTKSTFSNAYVRSLEISIFIWKKFLSLLRSRIKIAGNGNLLPKSIKRGFAEVLIKLLAILLIPYATYKIYAERIKKSHTHTVMAGNLVPKEKKDFRIRFDTNDKVYLFFASIDWQFRYQRPQSLASSLASQGNKVVYINPTILNSGEDLDYQVEVENDVHIYSFLSNRVVMNTYLGVYNVDSDLALDIAIYIEEILTSKFYSSCVLIVQQPGWWPVIKYLQGNQIAFDCMDLHSGFEDQHPRLAENESALLSAADQVIVSSPYLFDQLSDAESKRATIIRNGVDTNRFFYRSCQPRGSNPTIGYYGAVAEWFDFELVRKLADMNPELDFEIIGSVTDSRVSSALSKLKNVRLLGEMPINSLPKATAGWKVGLIPFREVDLIKATNPVKMYEYASMGIPIVSTDIPEVRIASSECYGIFPSANFEEFNTNLHLALGLDEQKCMNLNLWAKTKSWDVRVSELKTFLRTSPKVSIIVLMWNKGLMTLKCLKSLIERSDYENLEIFVVDNFSNLNERDVVVSYINSLADTRVRYVRNGSNLGFAGGMNVGIRESDGDFVVLLNNDTEVSPGWIWRSLKHFYRNPKLGLLGPSTNNCGNEARVRLRQDEYNWLAEVTQRFNFRESRILKVRTLAFFCTFIPRSMIETVGELSEDFLIGYFEDDDYCRRIEQINHEIGIARDIFVFHFMGASFDTLDSIERNEIFLRNRMVYESKWGKWTSHSYAIDEDQ